MIKDSHALDSSIADASNLPEYNTKKSPKKGNEKAHHCFNQNKKGNAFNYQEAKTKYINMVLTAPKIEQVKPALKQNFMPSHKKNAISNDLYAKPKDKFEFENKQQEFKAHYHEVRKQKRPKSSDSQAANFSKKMASKPMLFATIDNRKPNAFISEKYLIDAQKTPTDVTQGYSGSPAKLANKTEQSKSVKQIKCIKQVQSNDKLYKQVAYQNKKGNIVIYLKNIKLQF